MGRMADGVDDFFLFHRSKCKMMGIEKPAVAGFWANIFIFCFEMGTKKTGVSQETPVLRVSVRRVSSRTSPKFKFCSGKKRGKKVKKG